MRYKLKSRILGKQGLTFYSHFDFELEVRATLSR